MSEKVVIIGGVAGGASTAARLRRLNEQIEIIVLERGQFISFANCGLPYHIGEVIEERDKLLVQTPEAMEARFNIDVRIKNEVINIDREQKEVEVKELESGNIYRESYDKLVLSPGADPFTPPIPGIEAPNVFTLRDIPDTDNIKGFVDNRKPETAVVVGGGFIGIEMVENLTNRGLQVSLVELLDQVMVQFDREMASMIHNQLRTHGVNLHLGDGLDKIEHNQGKTEVLLQSGKKLPADMVILAIGVKPNAELAEKAGLELGVKGTIKVNEYLQTSDENIYALGDAVEVRDLVTGEPTHIPLAGPANKQGRIVANNINGGQDSYQATQGTSIARIFDLAAASTGANEKKLTGANIDYQVSYINSKNHAGYFPGAVAMDIKILFTPDEGKLLGAQIIGYDGVDKRIDLLAVAIRQKMTVFDLQELELAYAPPFGSAKDPVNMAGFTAGNIIKGLVDVIHWHEIEDLDSEVQLVDVREEVETRLGKIDNSINIPLNNLRDNLNQLDKNKPVVIYCAVGLRGYLACRILSQHGFTDVKNLSGGYKLYRAVKDDQQQIIESPEEGELTAVSNPEEGKIVGEKIAHKESGKRVELDASGLQCPGPIMQVYQKMKELNQGDILDVTATDPGFRRDIKVWCQNTGNTLIKEAEYDGKINVVIQKGTEDIDNKGQKPLSTEKKKGKTMIVFSGELDKAIASFVIANGAASMGNKVTLFFTFWGLNILRKDEYVETNKGFLDKMFGKMMPRGSIKLPLSNMNMMGFGPKLIRRVMKDKGIDSLEELIEQARANGVRLVACQMTMDVMGIRKEELIDGVEIGGVASFLGAADESNMSLFI